MEALRRDTFEDWTELMAALRDTGHRGVFIPNGVILNVSTVASNTQGQSLLRSSFIACALQEYQLDKGLLQGMLRVLPLDSVIADFGAGSGQYAKWLNDTGPFGKMMRVKTVNKSRRGMDGYSQPRIFPVKHITFDGLLEGPCVFGSIC